MFEEIRAIVAANLGVEEEGITVQTSFKEDLNADSLDLFEMVMVYPKRIRRPFFCLANLLPDPFSGCVCRADDSQSPGFGYSGAYAGSKGCTDRDTFRCDRGVSGTSELQRQNCKSEGY